MLFAMSPLSVLFVALIVLGVVPNLFYARGYWPHLRRKGQFALHYALFVGAMLAVVLADNGMTFLFAWEVMSLASWQLILTDGRSEKTQHAARFYFFMTHFGFMALLLFFLLAGQGDLTVPFEQLHTSPWVQQAPWLLFALLALGTLSKAGVVPLHVWLPYAHPAAPSPVSALMSGVMLKVAIYALLRLLLEVLHPWPVWWGMVILVLGSLSAVIGVLYALAEHDLKALLANHSIENIGIILIALGMGMIFDSLQLPTLAAFALIAALFHTFNHMSFKSLLFMGAGAVLHQTHTTRIESYGGLIKAMPVTALTFLFAAVSISALPPTNGFLSEWMVFQSLMGSVQFDNLGLKLLIPFSIFALALTGGLAIACFAKAFGITFLGLARSQNAAHAHEVNNWMVAGMVLMAGVVAALMLFAHDFLLAFNYALTGYGLPDIGTQLTPTFWQIQSLADNGGRVAPHLLLVLLLGVVALLYGVQKLLKVRTRMHHTWACGGRVTPRNQYTATGFAGPIRVFFSWLYQPEERIQREAHAEFDHHGSKFRRAEHHVHVHPLFEASLYEGAVKLVRGVSWVVYRVAHYETFRYSAMILTTLVALLLFWRLMWGGQ